MKPFDRAARPAAPGQLLYSVIDESQQPRLRLGPADASYVSTEEARTSQIQIVARGLHHCDLGAVQSILVAGCSILTQQHGEIDRVLRVSRATIGLDEQLQDREPG
jgi:hypothetical protein